MTDKELEWACSIVENALRVHGMTHVVLDGAGAEVKGFQGSDWRHGVGPTLYHALQDEKQTLLERLDSARAGLKGG